MAGRIDVVFPCFFSLEARDQGRVHIARLALDPTVSASGSTAAQAQHRLSNAVDEAVRQRGVELVNRLAAVPPDARVTVLHLRLPWRGERVEADVRALAFERGGVAFVNLPRVGVLLAVPAGLTPADWADAVARAADAWVRAKPPRVEDEEEDDDEAANAPPWREQRGDRVVWLERRLDVAWTWPKDENLALFLRAFGGGGPPNAREELPKVGRPLDALYPDRLLVDRAPDPRADRLRALLFEQRDPAPTALVGPFGAGKTTLVHAAVFRELEKRYAEDPKTVADLPRIWHLDPNRVIAGMSLVGAWERRLLAILAYLAAPGSGRFRHGLFVDQPLALARVGRSAGSALTLTTVLRPWLAQRRIPFVLECTPESWSLLEEIDRGFADLFRVERVAPPTGDRLAEILLSHVNRLNEKEGTWLQLGAVRRLLELERQHPARRGAPGGLVDRAAAAAEGMRDEEVEAMHVDGEVFRETGLARTMWRTATLRDADLRARLEARLIGQPRALDAVAELVHVIKAGLSRPGRPLAAWLLVGPTGVGKTETAKVLASTLLTSADDLVRLDMNEYGDFGAVARLLGDDTTEGHLPTRLRGRGTAVLLLDEIEKASPAVHDLLLQVLDEGRVTDGAGNLLDLRRVAILLTSNVGASDVARAAGFDRTRGALDGAYRAAVEKVFRPELVNRLDRVITYDPLSLDDVRRIADLRLTRLLGREGFRRRVVLLDVDPDALDALARVGFDPTLGARALKRVLEDNLAARVAALLAGAPVDRPLRLRVRPAPAGIEADVALLTFAERVCGPAPVEPDPAAALLALRDALPASTFRISAGPGGAQVDGADALRIREELSAALAAFEEEEPEVEVDLRHLARIATRPRQSKPRSVARGRWRNERVDWMAGVSFRSVREYLVDRASQPGVDLELADTPLALMRRRVLALGTGEPQVGRLVLRALVADAPALWAVAGPYLDGLRAAIETIGAVPDRQVRRPNGWRPDTQADATGVRHWSFEGPGVWGILAAEEGIHLFFPAEGPPQALVVERVAAPTDEPAPEPTRVVRLHTEGAASEDLATGLSGFYQEGEVAGHLLLVWAARCAAEEVR
jgi:ATP-dependent Clp protease ATP-binding subunit ClpC